MKRTEFRDIVLKKLEENHEALFQEIHEIAGTKSGDIAPEQQMELHGLTNKLVNLMVEQVMQNSPANVSYPVVLEKYKIAVRIDKGVLYSTPLYYFGNIEYSEKDDDWSSVHPKDIDISFIDHVYYSTGWIYLKDYALDKSTYKIRFDEK